MRNHLQSIYVAPPFTIELLFLCASLVVSIFELGVNNFPLAVPVQGVNRAFPFVSDNESDEIIAVQTPILFQLVLSITNLSDRLKSLLW